MLESSLGPFIVNSYATQSNNCQEPDFKEKRQQFLIDVHSTVAMEDIPPELVLNWDQTGIKMVPVSHWTMEEKGARRVVLTGEDDKRQITAVFCGSPLQVICKGKTPRCHPSYEFPLDWDITHTSNLWSTEETMVRYITNIIVPYVEGVRSRMNADDQPAVVIIDNFKGQITNRLLEENKIHTCYIPPNMTDVLQPMDLSVNKTAKDFLKEKFHLWYSESIAKQLEDSEVENNSVPLQPVDTSLQVMKYVGAKWLVEMFEHIQANPTIIVNGFIHSGISAACNGKFSTQSDDESDDESTDGEFDYTTDEDHGEI